MLRGCLTRGNRRTRGDLPRLIVFRAPPGDQPPPRTIEKYHRGDTVGPLPRLRGAAHQCRRGPPPRRRGLHLVAARALQAGHRATRYQDLQQFWKWYESEDEIPVSPMTRMTPPMMPEVPVPVLGADELRALLATCAGKDVRRPPRHAILRMFIDTGMRRRARRAHGDRRRPRRQRRRSSWARAGDRARARSAPRRPAPSTATSAPGRSTASPTSRRSGSPGSAR